MTEVTLPPLGTLLADKYRLDREIGRGGMGIVYAAHHETLGQQVAVKLLAVPGHAPPTVVDRFLREARAVVRLRSEHVVRVYDVGSLPGGIHYLVMDLLEGEDLMRRLQTKGCCRSKRPSICSCRPARGSPRPTRPGSCTAT
ncbi:MAG: protein kinase [Myxococcales bacterium]|nr:protein kinase [Myxococcales bacterium]